MFGRIGFMVNRNLVAAVSKRGLLLRARQKLSGRAGGLRGERKASTVGGGGELGGAARTIPRTTRGIFVERRSTNSSMRPTRSMRSRTSATGRSRSKSMPGKRRTSMRSATPARYGSGPNAGPGNCSRRWRRPRAGGQRKPLVLSKGFPKRSPNAASATRNQRAGRELAEVPEEQFADALGGPETPTTNGVIGAAQPKHEGDLRRLAPRVAKSRNNCNCAGGPIIEF